MRGGMSYSYLGSRRKSLISRGLDDSTGSNGSDSITVHLNEAPISQDLGQIEDDDVHSDSSSPVARRIINNFGRKKKAFMHLATDEDISSPIQTGNNPLVIAALQFEKIVGDKHDMEIEMTNGK